MHRDGGAGACLLEHRLLRKRMCLRLWQVVDRGWISLRLLLWPWCIERSNIDGRWRRWNESWRWAMHLHGHLRLDHGRKSHDRPGHSRTRWRDEVARSYGRTPTHTTQTRGVDTSVVATAVDTRPPRISANRAEACPRFATDTLLVRPHCPGNEDERPVHSRKYVARRVVW